jgi:hypothetical protein
MANFVPPPLPVALTEAPGAKAARTCGIVAIIAAVTCVGIPVAIVLGIIALVQQGKAKRLAQEFPQDYSMPTSSGMVLGIIGLVAPFVMLPIVGIVSAIAIPAVLAQRDRAYSKAVTMNISTRMEQLIQEYDKGKEVGLDQTAIHANLEHLLQDSKEHNPLNPGGPAYRQTISIISAQSIEEAQQQAEAEATTEGEAVFVISYTGDGQHSGFIAGAARLKRPIDGSPYTSKAFALD